VSVIFGQEANTFATIVANGTGLSIHVVEAWVLAENSIHIRGSAPGHNWLNIGPGHTYPSVQSAAQATVQLIQSAPQYQGIRDSEGSSDAAQLAEIAASPWDLNHYGRNRLSPAGSLASTYREAGGQGAVEGTGPGAGVGQGGINQAVGGVTSSVSNALGILTNVGTWERVGLVVGGLALSIAAVVFVAREVK
jgi:hypothetical protein